WRMSLVQQGLRARARETSWIRPGGTSPAIRFHDYFSPPVSSINDGLGPALGLDFPDSRRDWNRRRPYFFRTLRTARVSLLLPGDCGNAGQRGVRDLPQCAAGRAGSAF